MVPMFWVRCYDVFVSVTVSRIDGWSLFTSVYVVAVLCVFTSDELS